MSNKLSHSSIRLFQECPKKYEYYYRQKLREKVKSGALIFGTSFDKATEAIIKDPSIDDKAVFDESFATQEINKKQVHIPDSLLLVYSQSDYDGDLLKEEDVRFLEAKAKELVPELDGNLESLQKQCASFKKQARFRAFKNNERKFLNLCNWASLRRKGHVMLDSFRAKVLPQLHNIEGTQVKIELVNDTGDAITGFADYVGKYGENPERLVLDFKTSSIEYESDSAVISPQLALYAHSLNINHAGFVVFSKRILKNKIKKCGHCGFDGTGNRMATCNNTIDDKRCGKTWIETICPEAEVKVIIDKIPKQTTDIVLENAEIVNTLINQGLFIRNLGSCKTSYGICPYYSLCFKNKTDGLEKVE